MFLRDLPSPVPVPSVSNGKSFTHVAAFYTQNTMEELAFELSEEHGTLPKSEVIASIETYGWNYKITGDYDQLLTLETDADPAVLAQRLALTHNILRLIFVCPADEAEMLKHAETATWACRKDNPSSSGCAG